MPRCCIDGDDNDGDNGGDDGGDIGGGGSGGGGSGGDKWRGYLSMILPSSPFITIRNDTNTIKITTYFCQHHNHYHHHHLPSLANQ